MGIERTDKLTHGIKKRSVQKIENSLKRLTYNEKMRYNSIIHNERARVESNSTLYLCIERIISMTNTEKKISECLKPIIERLGYSLYDVIYEKEGTQNYLRIFIDKPEGIGINDCENVNNAITDILDEKDFIKNTYFLEVSSPGIERRIRNDEHIKQNIGKKVRIKTFNNNSKTNSKELIGVVKESDSQSVSIEIEGIETNEIIKIDKKNIAKMITIYNWEDQ